MLTRYPTSRRKMIVLSILCGVLVALTVSSLQSLYRHNQREQRYNVLLDDLRNYLTSYFLELKTTTNEIQPLTASSCNAGASFLTSRSALHVNVRAFLLVKDGIAYCSSATGSMAQPLDEIAPDINTHKALDISILPGKTTLSGKPAIAVWFGAPQHNGRGVFTILNVNLTPYLLYTSRQRDIGGVALVANNKAITTFSTGVVARDALPPEPTGISQVPGYPVTLYLFGDLWPAEDIQVAVLLGLFIGVLSAFACYYIMTNRMRADREILTGIKRHQFFVVWQPVVRADTLKVTGAEALMRWKHPQAGTIPPDAFISYAEAQNLIVPLTQHLFRLIATEAVALQEILPAGSKLGVNIAPGHLHSPGFKEDVQKLLDNLPRDYFQLVFEVTERDMLNETEALTLFEWLHSQGIEIAVDDFGTGHSALIYLERFTLDYLKIDRGFIHAIGQETITSPVLEAVLALAKKLNMTTVAEGVETPGQARWLRNRGVDYLQGYLFSQPLPLEELLRWCRARGHKAAAPSSASRIPL